MIYLSEISTKKEGKMRKSVQYLMSVLFTFILTSVTPTLAKTINLYEQPKSDSKVVGNVDSASGVIAIFSPKDSGWIKVADPRNGDVGWIKSTDLTNAGFSFNIISTGNGSHTYQVIQYGNTPQSSEQMQKIMNQIQIRQQAIQKDVQQMMQDMFSNPHQPGMNMPMILPVVVVPEKALSPAPPKPAAAPALAPTPAVMPPPPAPAGKNP